MVFVEWYKFVPCFFFKIKKIGFDANAPNLRFKTGVKREFVCD